MILLYDTNVSIAESDKMPYFLPSPVRMNVLVFIKY